MTDEPFDYTGYAALVPTEITSAAIEAVVKRRGGSNIPTLDEIGLVCAVLAAVFEPISMLGRFEPLGDIKCKEEA